MLPKWGVAKIGKFFYGFLFTFMRYFGLYYKYGLFTSYESLPLGDVHKLRNFSKNCDF